MPDLSPVQVHLLAMTRKRILAVINVLFGAIEADDPQLALVAVHDVNAMSTPGKDDSILLMMLSDIYKERYTSALLEIIEGSTPQADPEGSHDHLGPSARFNEAFKYANPDWTADIDKLIELTVTERNQDA